MTVKDDIYKEIRKKITTWMGSDEGKKHKFAQYILCAPDLLHLLCKLALDKDVPTKDKAKLAGAIAYFISPVDLLPELLVGPVGYLDDIALAAHVLNGVLNNIDQELVRKHWAGEGDVLEMVQQILKVADEMVGSGLWRKLKKIV